MLQKSISTGRAATLLIFITPITILIFSFSPFYLGYTTIAPYTNLLSPAFNFAGLILLALSMRGLTKHYKDPSLFKNTLYGSLTLIVGVAFFYCLSYVVFPSIFTDLTAIPYSMQTPETLASLFLDILVFSVILWIGIFIVYLVSGIFFRRAFYGLAEKTGEDKFRQAGFWIFLGGLTSIIFIGALFVFVAWLFALLGFSSLNKKSKTVKNLSEKTL